MGAARMLKDDLQNVRKENRKNAPQLASEGVPWHFIPPAAPHFGGIWESRVKSVKYHLKRIIADNNLTYEEMSTLLAQIEAVLNSNHCMISVRIQRKLTF